jgi:Protein of unknown function (DUF2852)
MTLAAKLEEAAQHPLWVAAMIVGFIFWWPIGLMILFWGIWSRHMGCWGHSQRRWQETADRFRDPAAWWGPRSSGNHAFDEYRTETLRRLEEEQREFREFLERLRFAKDRAEFDQFMAERRRRSEGPAPQPQG